MRRYYFLAVVLFISFPISAQKKKLVVEEIFSNRAFYGTPTLNVQWHGDNFSYLKNEKNNSLLIDHNAETGREEIIFSLEDLKNDEGLKDFKISNYKWSDDGTLILFTGVLPARSVKTGGNFYIYDPQSKKIIYRSRPGGSQSIIKISPDGKNVGYVRDNNLFICNIETGEETQITFDGNENIINGQFDWVYEEEFSIIEGWMWAPDSKSIAFWRFDQTNVPTVKIGKWDSLYLNTMEMKYPKPGGRNSEVKIGIYDIEKSTTTWMDLGTEKDIYIPRMMFTADPQILSVQKLSRCQQKLELLFFNIKSGQPKLILQENDSCWVDIFDDLTFLKNKKQFIWSSERDNFRHLYFYDYNGNLINQITQGNWEIKSIAGVNEEKNTIYYLSNERGRLYQDLYSINFNSKNKHRLTNGAGNHDINLSGNTKYYLDRYSNANLITSQYLYKISGEKIRDLIVNNMEICKDYGRSPVEFFSFRTSDNYILDASIIKPQNFDESKQYPVLITNYNGPGSQTVSDSWDSGMWYQLLSQNDIIVIEVDSRITGGRGTSYKKFAYKNLGHWEINDLIETAKYLGSLGFVDTSKIGIWGWSYGGYTSAMTILKGADYFSTAIAVAPVTDWRFYDDIYTERYMSTPDNNPEGYKNGSCLEFADKLNGKLLLVHGTADDNVHFQNSIELVNRFIANKKQIQVMFYPERDHGIYGGSTRVHLYNLMTNFLLENLKAGLKKKES